MNPMIVYLKFDALLLFILPNVELIRAKDGATPAPQEECLTQASDPVIG